MTIIYDEKICVRCLACVGESECGGVTYKRGQIQIDETRTEDWANIAAICPVAAISIGGDLTDGNNVCILPDGVDTVDTRARSGHSLYANHKSI